MKISIGAKILALLGITTVVGLGLSFMSHRITNEVAASSQWVAHTYEVINEFELIGSNLKDAETSQRGYIITGEDRFLETYRDGVAKIQDHFVNVRKLTSDNEHQQIRLEKLKTLLDKRVENLATNVEIRKNDGFEAVKKNILADVGRKTMNEIRTILDEAAAEESALLTKRSAANNDLIQMARTISMAGAALFIFVFAMTAIFIRRSILGPLQQVMTLANEISVGNLKQNQLDVRSNDEIGDLARIFNTMLSFLREMAKQNTEVASNLGTAASEILAAIQQQAAAVREQAAAIQQTTTTMEEIGQSGAQVNERGRQISNSAELTLTAANAGIGAVQGTNLTMVGIRSQVESVAENIVNLSERNQTIGELITSVNDIAEQSNLLALNAAIEAADAGDHGRRFSVVANEMKNLSEQCKGATVQVRLILGQIQKGINTSVMLTEEAVKRAEGGKQQADLAEKTILQLTGTTNESVKTFQQIIGATNQQQIGFEQITQALKSIRIGAEQTAASTSQLEKAALSLNNLGQQLQVTSQRYKT